MQEPSVFTTAAFFSCSYARRDVLPLGKFTVNLSGCPAVASYTERLYQLLQQLVPSVSPLHTFALNPFFSS